MRRAAKALVTGAPMKEATVAVTGASMKEATVAAVVLKVVKRW